MLQRKLENQIREALSDTPVVTLLGARQTGKSTLVKKISGLDRRYLTMDDLTTLSLAKANPQGFLHSNQGNMILDEVQLVPELFPAIKLAVDTDRVAGRFLLTGSANVLALPKISESLAGRTELFTMWPLAQAEVEGLSGGFIDQLFSDRQSFISSSVTKEQVIHQMLSGGYPEVVLRDNERRRKKWFNSYLTTLLSRDIRNLAEIEGYTQLPNLLTLLAARAATLINFADIGVSLKMPQTTLKRYVALLDAMFLITVVPAWSANFTSRLVKSPKLLFADSGLMAHVLGLNAKRFEVDQTLFGPYLENWVGMELTKLLTWSETEARLFHFRTHTHIEVDYVLEASDGRLAGIEIKAAASVKPADFKGLKALAEGAGGKFARGVVLYFGSETIAFDQNLWAIPIASIWK